MNILPERQCSNSGCDNRIVGRPCFQPVASLYIRAHNRKGFCVLCLKREIQTLGGEIRALEQQLSALDQKMQGLEQERRDLEN
jgi:hypothetical protein